MNSPDYFISGDWGTSNFRLRIVERHTLRVLAEHCTDQGVKRVYDRFRRQDELDRQTFFAHYLSRQIRMLPDLPNASPVILTGMASSNIGLLELDYTTLPYDDSGSGLNWSDFRLPDHRPVILISGVKGAQGMMRGEETQALGLSARLAPCKSGILILPGTHSKHLSFREGKFFKLKNFMTGELFALLTQNSLLKVSVQAEDWTPRCEPAFREGLERGRSGKLSASLFAVRARHLLHKHAPVDNYFFLSGLLIGDELAYLCEGEEIVVLAAPAALFPLYKIALETMLPMRRRLLLGEGELEKALLMGQQKILQQYEERKYFSLETL